MPSKKNRGSSKGQEAENRTGSNRNQRTGYQKLPDNPRHRSDESISTSDNPAGGKYSKTGKRDDEVKNENTCGGR